METICQQGYVYKISLLIRIFNSDNKINLNMSRRMYFIIMYYYIILPTNLNILFRYLFIYFFCSYKKIIKCL
jgi:hypothetical protein